MELEDQNIDAFIRHRYCVAPPPGNRLSPFEIWSIMLQVALGLSFMHKHALIHRDLRPANSN